MAKVQLLVCCDNNAILLAMRKVWFVALVLLGASCMFGQDDAITLDDLAQSAQQWAQDNLDENALQVLKSVDQEKVRQLFKEIQKGFHGEYVVDLAALKDSAKALIPLLESCDETLPYAIWFKVQLDYLEVADQFRLIIPPPETEPGRPPRPAPNPSPQLQRDIWIEKLVNRPWPDAAKSYVSLLKPVFAAQKIPPELVWLAEVESSFDPRARSPEGAAGLFQLMPATARQYGLRVWPFDQRLKPEPSARAAAKYLGALHRRFKDWRLTLAAYNAGEGTVQKLLAHSKTHTFDAIATRLPAETQMFVPRVEATLLRREGVRLAELHALDE